MVDKVFGADYDNLTDPAGTETVSVNNGTALKDVRLDDLVAKVANNATAKALEDADTIGYHGNTAGALRKTTWATLKTTFGTALGGLIAGFTGKTTPVDADTIVIADSAASNASKSVTWANVKATLKTYLDTLYSPIAKGVTNGDSHDHNGGDGAQVNHTTLSNIGTNTHAQIDTFIATTAPATYAPIAKGVTNGDSHDHVGGDGATLAYTSLSGRPPDYLPFGVYTGINPMTTSPAAPYAASIDRSTTLVQWAQSYFVQTTNNGSNYWTITLHRITDGATIATFNTSAVAADTWHQSVINSFSITILTAVNRGCYIGSVKSVGAPGGLYLAGPLLQVTY